MATAKALADLIKAGKDKSWMVCHAICQRDNVRQLEQEVRDLNEYKKQASQLK